MGFPTIEAQNTAILVCDILNTMLREFITIISTNRPAGIATLVMYAILFVVAVISSIVVIPVLGSCFSHENPKPYFAYFVTGIIASILYFYGDNVPIIVQQFGEDIGCSDVCIRNTRIASIILLCVSLLARHVSAEPLIGVWKLYLDRNNKNNVDSKESNERNKKTALISLKVAAMFSDLHLIDNIYTAVTLATQSTDFCSNFDLNISWSVLTLCVVIGITSLLLRAYAAFSYFSKHKYYSLRCATLAAICGCLCIALLLYLLADNEQPLDCRFGCDSYASSFNLTDISMDQLASCQLKASSGTRLALIVLAFILVVIGMGLSCLNYLLLKEDELENSKNCEDCIYK